MLEIYYDFSGYSDMAIGLGYCFGFHFEENFNYPYISKSVTEFWKRWHISLTSWFRDYVYIPLGGNRVSAGRHLFNLLIVWLFTGVWHGANWTFVVWGIIYFIFQALEKKLPVYKKFPAFFGHVYTLLVVCLNWVIFKSSSLTYAFKYIVTMLGYHAELVNRDALLYLRSGCCVVAAASLGCIPWQNIIKSNVKIKIAGRALQLLLFIITVMTVINGAYSPFIYFNF